jgi:hypothetical protein
LKCKHMHSHVNAPSTRLLRNGPQLAEANLSTDASHN